MKWRNDHAKQQPHVLATAGQGRQPGKFALGPSYSCVCNLPIGAPERTGIEKVPQRFLCPQ